MAEKGIELGTFEVRASDDGGAEVRLASEKKGSNFLLRDKSVGKDMRPGQRGRLMWHPEADPEPGTVTVEVPADETAGLTPAAKVVDEGTKKARK